MLRLDIQRNAIERQALSAQTDSVRADWTQIVDELRGRMRAVSAIPMALPTEPTAEWPPTQAPTLSVLETDKWTPIDDVIEEMNSRLRAAEQAAIPTVTEAANEIAETMKANEAELIVIEERLRAAQADLTAESYNERSLKTRISSIREDLRRYQDEKKLRDRGSQMSFETELTRCPVCERPMKDVLLPQERVPEPMSLETNINFLTDQVGIYTEMLSETDSAVEERKIRFAALSGERDEVLRRIRVARETLASDGRAPSAVDIRARLKMEERLAQLSSAKADFETELGKLAGLATRWAELQADLIRLRSVGLSEKDNKKLSELQVSFVSQLREYGFNSLEVESISISKDTYRPISDGYDLGGMSASDTIRTVWAYLLALLEVSRNNVTNHLGLLILDEPRQQHAAKVSFDALLKRSASATAFGQQVIFATSEEEDSLKQMLTGIPCNIIELPIKALRPLSQ